MRFTSIASALALTATLVSASPINPGTSPNISELERRAQAPYYFSTAAQNKGYDDCEGHLKAQPPTTVMGSNGKSYPEYYGNSDNIALPAECTAAGVIDLRIYPVFIDQSTFTAGKNPNLDRVVVARINGGTYARCGLITHRGQTGNKFVKCT